MEAKDVGTITRRGRRRDKLIKMEEGKRDGRVAKNGIYVGVI